MANKTTIRRLFKAIRHDDLEQVTTLLTEHPELVRACALPPPKKDDGQSPLQVALKTGMHGIAELLLDRGADVDFMEAPTVQGRVPVLHDAVRAALEDTFWLDHEPGRSDRSISILRRMLEMGARTSAVDFYGNTCLHRAGFDVQRIAGFDPPKYERREGCFHQVFSLLLKHGADPDQEGLRPRASQMFKGHAVYRFLIGTPHDDRAENPLLSPIREHDRSAVEDYVSRHPGALSGRDSAGRTPLMNAVICGDIGIVRFMVDQGADVRAREANAEAWPVLHLGLWSRPITRLLLERGAEVDATDAAGWTALARVFHVVSSDGWRIATAANLLEFGANEDTRTPEGKLIRDLRERVEKRT